MAANLPSCGNAGVASSSIQDCLLPNTLYLTFNRPEKDEFVGFPTLGQSILPKKKRRAKFLKHLLTAGIAQHRALFITTDQLQRDSALQEVGTLFHAVYENETWRVERKTVENIDNSKNLVLLWRISSVPPRSMPRVDAVLQRVPFHAANGDSYNGSSSSSSRAAGQRLSRHIEKGLPLLGGYSCILWTEEALRALERDGIIQVTEDVGK
jgi:hypothetical protein